MKSNKVRMTLTAAVVGLSMVAGACASQSDPVGFANVDRGSTSSAAIQPVTEPDEVIGGGGSTRTTSVASEPDYLTVHEAIDIVGNGGSIKPGDVKATTDMDDIFIAYLDGKGISLSEDEALRSAVTACSFLMQYGDFDELWAEIAADPYSPDIIPGVDNSNDLPVLMGAAVGAYCPHLD